MVLTFGNRLAADITVIILVSVRVTGAGEVCVAIVTDQVVVRIVMRARVIVVCVVVFSAVACSIDDYIIVKILSVLDANLGTSSSGDAAGDVVEAIKTVFNLLK